MTAAMRELAAGNFAVQLPGLDQRDEVGPGQQVRIVEDEERAVGRHGLQEAGTAGAAERRVEGDDPRVDRGIDRSAELHREGPVTAIEEAVAGLRHPAPPPSGAGQSPLRRTPRAGGGSWDRRRR